MKLTPIDGALRRLQAALENGVSDQMKAFLRITGRLWHYSWSNLLLIAAQRPDATHVAGYQTWRKLKRHVRRGERAIRIYAPIVIRRKEEAEQNDEEEDVVGFRVVNVFDVSQTDGQPLPEPCRATGDPGEQLSRLEAFVRSRGIGLEYGRLGATTRGYSRRGCIVLRGDLASADAFSTLAHELAHVLMHFGQTKVSRATAELEAEAVAFSVCTFAGLESTTASADYIKLYRGTRQALAASLQRIQQAAKTIIDGIHSIDVGEQAATPPLVAGGGR